MKKPAPDVVYKVEIRVAGRRGSKWREAASQQTYPKLARAKGHADLYNHERLEEGGLHEARVVPYHRGEPLP